MNQFKPIKRYEGLYSITTNGDVISHGGKSNHKKDIVLRPSIDKDGYRRVALKHMKKTEYFRVCRLVALHFIPNPNGYPFVNHIDENKANDTACNLEWVDAYKNWKHSEHRQVNAEQAVIKLDMNEVIIDTYKSLMDAARATGIGQGNITNCIKGRCKSVGGYKWKLKMEKTND